MSYRTTTTIVIISEGGGGGEYCSFKTGIIFRLWGGVRLFTLFILRRKQKILITVPPAQFFFVDLIVIKGRRIRSSNLFFTKGFAWVMLKKREAEVGVLSTK